MPYIRPEERDMSANSSAFPYADTPGMLNYNITVMIIQYMKRMEMDYQSINDVLGALEGAKLEFVRRVVNPYEDSKIKINGDVYPEEYRSKPE